MEVYLDLVFLLNFLLDGAVLLTTAWVRNIRVPLWRVLSASFLGGSYAVLMFFPSFSFLFTIVCKLLFSSAMIFAAFGFRGWAPFLKNWFVFYFANITVGGAVLSLHYLLAPASATLENIRFLPDGSSAVTVRIGIAFLLFAFLFGVGFYRKMFDVSRRDAATKPLLAEVVLFIADRRLALTGLMDTGNRLYDPLSGIPVMVVEVQSILSAVPKPWDELLLRVLDKGNEGKWEWAYELPDEELKRRLRWVPYRGVNKETQLLLAIKPDKVVIRQNDRFVETERIWIGLEIGQLCRDGTYQAIIHPALISQVP